MKAALKLSERVLSFALHKMEAREAFERFGLDAFEAVKPHASLPETFRTKRYPQMQEFLARKRGSG